MRHAASLVSALEGISRQAYQIARELAQNSRSGLTARFLSKKLELPMEEVEYLVDVNDRLFFFDLTKVKLVAEGQSAVKRIGDGLESLGDVATIFRNIKNLPAHEFRRLEDQLTIDRPVGKKAAAEELLTRYYNHPDSVVEYVATRGFNPAAQELFDIVWQSDDGVMPVALIRAAHGGSEFDVEQGLHELFRSFALFEMFRFDSEDRLVRVAGLLSEIRQWREQGSPGRRKKPRLKQIKGKPDTVDDRGLDFSDRICRLVAAIAARPARLRGDGDLFREDRRRLGEIAPEDDEPSLSTSLWVAQGTGWLARVDNELRAGALDDLIQQHRVERHRVLFDWLCSRGSEADARRMMAEMLDELKADAWYPVMDFIQYALHRNAENEQPVLRNAGGHWHYISPSSSQNAERNLARCLEEAFLWLGLVDRGSLNGDPLFRLTEAGRCFLNGEELNQLGKAFPKRDGEFIVQPNFDIVVPLQDMDPLVTVPLDQFCDRMSTGQVTVYRLTKDAFTQAIQEGHDGNAFVQFLITYNRGRELPSNVMTTLEDWRGGMKHVRLRTIHVLESDDPLVMADLLHRKKLQKHFIPVDPKKMVAYTKITKSELGKLLEKEGFVIN